MRTFLALMLTVAALLLSVPPRSVATADSSAPSVTDHIALLNVPIADTPETVPYGTVTRVAPKKWVTAAHVLENDTSRDYHVAQSKAYFKIIDVENDLAGFHVPDDPAGSGLKLAGRAPKAGDEIHAAGYPFVLVDWMFISGKVANPTYQLGPNKKIMAYDMRSCGGFSGSPVINEYGQLVSILQVGMGQQPCGVFSGGATHATLKTFLKLFLAMK